MLGENRITHFEFDDKSLKSQEFYSSGFGVESKRDLLTRDHAAWLAG